MEVKSKSAFTEAWLDLQLNAARKKKKKKKNYWAEAECHRVTGFFCSSDYSSGRRLWIWAEKEAFKCILCPFWRER